MVSTARTGIARAYKGALNRTKSPTILGHLIPHAVERAGIDPTRIEDAVAGTVPSAGTAGMNLSRNALLAAGLRKEVAGQTLNRQCASGLMAIATAAKEVIVDGTDVVVAGGQEDISAVQTKDFSWVMENADPAAIAQASHTYMAMLQTAEFVAKRYEITREQDAYALESQRRMGAVQEAGRFADGIVRFQTTMRVIDKAKCTSAQRQVILDRDGGNRPDTTLEGLASLKPVIEGRSVTAGSASQLLTERRAA